MKSILRGSKRLNITTVLAALLLVAGTVAGGLTLQNQIAQGQGTGPLAFTSPGAKTVYVSGNLGITDLSLTGGDEISVLNINLYVPNGALAFGSSDGLTFVGASSGQNLQFSGVKNDINAALATLTYAAPNTIGEFKLEALINGEGGGVVWSNGVNHNSHAYKVVTVGGGVDWNAAKAAAEAQTFGGVPGYLATIASEEEHNFILSRINQDGWIGASDAAVEGEWRWMAGPEAGQQFWQGNGSGSTVNGLFANWNQQGGAVEPNNSGAGEDCAQIRFTANSQGRWNDLPCTTLLSNYVVEFGAPGALPSIINTSFNITVETEKFTASFDTQGGTTVAPIIGLEAHEVITLPDAPQRAGYIFDAWLHMSESIDEYQAGDEFSMYIVDASFVARWVEDGNVDEIPDDEQDNVVMVSDPASEQRVVLELDESCDVASANVIQASNLAISDDMYQYDTGFVNFTATGCDNDKTTVNLYYYGLPSDDVTVRKHNPNKQSFFTINEALLTKQTVVGQDVTVVSYEVADGGDLDIDGIKNGTIVDPVGLGRLLPGVPNTGLGGGNIAPYAAIAAPAGLSLLILFVAIFRRKSFENNNQ